MVIWISCEAPRTNPLDPNNPTSSIGIIKGSVKTQKVPRTPIYLTKIFKDNYLISITDYVGNFAIDISERNNFWLIFDNENYKRDSVYINWNGEKELFTEVFLNQKPVLDSVKFYSVVFSRFSLPPLIKFIIQAKVTDEDKDIDSVALISDELQFKNSLIYDPNTKYYSSEIMQSDFENVLLKDLIGKDFQIIVKDLVGDNFILGKTFIRRILSEAPEYIRPSNYDTVGTKPHLEWYEYEPGYTFSFSVEVYRYEFDFSTSLVWKKSGLNNELTEITIDKDLEAGNHFWVIYCIDEFGNQIRSNPASFTVKK